MMIIGRSSTAALVAALLAAGCATAPASAPDAVSVAPEAAAFDPAGTYDFDTQVSGQAATGVIRIDRAESGAYTGSVSSSVTGQLPVRAVDVQGSRVRVTAAGQLGDMLIDLDVSGYHVTGSWSYAGQTGSLTGRRR